LGAIMALVIFSVCFRHSIRPRLRDPVYFVGQLLESSLIPLDSISNIGISSRAAAFWPLLLLSGKGTLPGCGMLSLFCLPMILAVLCMRAPVYGPTFEQACFLAQVNPESPGAGECGSYEVAHGAADQAARRLEAAAGKMPDEVQLTLNWIDAECAIGRVSSKGRTRALFPEAESTNTSSREMADSCDQRRRTESLPGPGSALLDTIRRL